MEQSKNSYSILIVDPNPDDRDNLHQLLEANDFRVRAAASGSEALGIARKYRPDVIISETSLNDYDGDTLLAEIHRDSSLQGMFFMFLTSEPDSSKLRKAADAYLLKPVTSKKVLQVLTRLLR